MQMRSGTGRGDFSHGNAGTKLYYFTVLFITPCEKGAAHLHSPQLFA